MVKRILRLWETGNSSVVTIPQKDVDLLELKSGDCIEVEIKKKA